MRHPKSAFWQCLHAPGHDSALLAPDLIGWHLHGMAAFRLPDGPVGVNYSLEMDQNWVVRRGSIQGFAGDRSFFHSIARHPDGWMLDGEPNGLADLTDLDFGFTPATNLQQLKRAGLEIGQRAEFSVAWFDIGKEALVALPQIYERRDETHYWYESPTADGYQAMLEIEPDSGFARVYPDLWEMADGAPAGRFAADPLAHPTSSLS